MSHRPLIDLWPSIRDFADDIGVSYNTAKHIRRRGMIPDGYWEAAIEGANRRGFKEVTYPLLANIAAKARPVGRRPRPVWSPSDIAAQTAGGFNPDEMLEGYQDGIEGFRCGGNRSRSYQYGWRKGRDAHSRLPAASEEVAA